MKYTGVVRRVYVFGEMEDVGDNTGFWPLLGYGVEGKFIDTDGSEQWRASKVLTQ